MKFIVVSMLVLVLSLNLSANCENKLFSFSIKESAGQSITIMDVIENISDECKMTIIFEDSSVKDALSMRLNFININDLSLRGVLDLLLSDNNIFYEITNSGTVLRVATFKTRSYFMDYVSFSTLTSETEKTIKTGSSGDAEGSTTMGFSTEFEFWDKITEEIGIVLHRDEDVHQIEAEVLLNKEAGMLTVTGTKKQLYRVERYIDSLMSRLHKEILIETRIIEVSNSVEDSTGIDWSEFELSISGGTDALRQRTPTSLIEGFRSPNYLIGYDFDMTGLMNFLKTQGDVRVVSSPKIMTLNNQSAIINVGTNKNFRVQTETTENDDGETSVTYEADSVFVGVTLDITPQVTKDDYVILKINPIVSEIDEEHRGADDIPVLAPDIKIKQLSSIVKVKSGHRVIIGGLVERREESFDSSVPGLSLIPILGKAFQSNTIEHVKSELIIVITPRIVDGRQSPSLDQISKKKTW